ncbi:PspC domain-containing protein [Rhodococcus sp. HNM0563]|uniref:ATP-binding protein n=1 Tax=unclassified Rhodococcus (in: high G+C Gram-positive bacteria) TaxID=192944 RepID=UPI00146C6504|nr:MULTISPECIES: ATP-binding protein [unclassified Rhodococcus (in: high G+C Gram-positive bacteria)]MCK0093325.1 PspC domain-containing protein [Rhodococcus sp. F64268]NLU60728.1 PspC domain-containing protein [Rhodococcus sp. HNM0563]
MPRGATSCQYRLVDLVSGLPVPVDRLQRRVGGRVVGGVAGGLADHLDIDVTKVRVAFTVLAALGGLGIVAYGLLWMFVPPGADTDRPSGTERRRAVGLAVMGIALAIGLSWLFSGGAASAIAPVVVVSVGAALVWREFDAEGPRSVFGLPAKPTVLAWARVLGGLTLVVTGLGVVVLAQVDVEALRSSLLAVIVTLVGAALLSVPLWIRMWRALETERAARVRTEERDEIASHLHDSVLQTLALIQKQADSPQEVVRLARSQERELRRWLFGGDETPRTSLAEALRTIAGEVEDQRGVSVAPVIVGDVAPDDEDVSAEAFTAVLGATREALVNAAKHAQVDNIDLFAEVEPHEISVFVRDRGVGFDPDTVPEDRHGLARSITARIERRGGRTVVKTALGKGTEVRIHMPRSGGGHAPETTPQTAGTEEATLEWEATQPHHEEQPQ